jgi:chitinase
MIWGKKHFFPSRFRLILSLLILLLNWACHPYSSTPENPPAPALPNLAKVVIGYYPAWKKADFDFTRIKYEYLTHIAHAFTKPDADGNLIVPPDYLYPELAEEAHRYGVKVIMSVGGWGNCEGFPGMSATLAMRTRFIIQTLDFLKTYHYDGVDIDWEFVSNPVEQNNFASLIKELGAALHAQKPPLLLTMAAPSNHYWGRWINYEEVVGSFDYVGCMTYDYHGEWSDHSGHNSPLYSCGNDPCGSFNDSFLYCLSRSIPPDKLLLGLPFFGRSFDSSEFYQKFQKSLYYGFAEIMDLRAAGWTSLWDDCAQVPYFRKPDQSVLLSYDDEKSIALKCRFVNEKKAAGVIIWEISQDFIGGDSVLLSTVGKEFAKPEKSIK